MHCRNLALRSAKETRKMSLHHIRRELQVLLRVLLRELDYGVLAEELGVHGHHPADHQLAEAVAQAGRGDAPVSLLGKQCFHAGVERLRTACVQQRKYNNKKQ